MGINQYDFKRVGGGLLVQSPDAKNVQPAELHVVSKKQPTPQQLQDLMFAWRVAKFVKSNAIVFCANGMTLGVGAGQMSRVDIGPHRLDQGAERRPVAGRFGGGVGCLLPVPRRPGRGGRCGCDLRHPAGRLHARPGSHRTRPTSAAW